MMAEHQMHEGEQIPLQTQGLAAGYQGTAVVHGVDITVRAGQVVTLVGPNGSGKSTVLKTVAGQLEALGGRVLLGGEDLAGLSVAQRSRQVSVLLTDRVRTQLLTCADVVEAGRYPHTGRLGLATAEDRAKVREAMQTMRVWDLRDHDFMQLSDGQRQRVMLARALCQEPQLLVLDEPTSHLDIRYQIELLGALRQLAATQGLAILMTLHELPLARRVSDWLVCVKDGRITMQGTPDQVFVPQVINELFDLEPDMYDALTGDVRLDAIDGSAGAQAAGGRHA